MDMECGTRLKRQIWRFHFFILIFLIFSVFRGPRSNNKKVLMTIVRVIDSIVFLLTQCAVRTDSLLVAEQ